MSPTVEPRINAGTLSCFSVTPVFLPFLRPCSHLVTTTHKPEPKVGRHIAQPIHRCKMKCVSQTSVTEKAVYRVCRYHVDVRTKAAVNRPSSGDLCEWSAIDNSLRRKTCPGPVRREIDQTLEPKSGCGEPHLSAIRVQRHRGQKLGRRSQVTGPAQAQEQVRISRLVNLGALLSLHFCTPVLLRA